MNHQKIVVKEAKKVYPKPQPYLSIDIETTSLDPKTGVILEVAAVYDDLESPLEDLMRFHKIIDYSQEAFMGDAYAIQMNVDIFREMCALKTPIAPVDFLEVVAKEWHTFLANLPEGKAGKRFTVAGKNAAGFDIPWLNHHLFATSAFKHKVLDPAPMYFQELGKMASLLEIKKHIGLEDSVSHGALDDALDVIKCIREKLGVKYVK